MGKSRKACIAGVCILLAVVAVASFFIGYKGIEANDINYRGEFVFLLAEETALEWRGTEIEVSDLAVNDMVSITFAGEIQETYPARIMNVVKVQLLGEK